ncbi:MAG: class I SAM-dependent methyltransferase, partial [Balneolaceae bacterium]
MQAQPTTLFTTKSEAFAKYRAGYSKEAIDTILAPFANQTKITAVDVGAGTGIATRLLADQGAETIGVEPNASMIRAASPHPNMSFIQSDAESIPLEDDYADVVTSFHAFHWFDFKISLGEFNRILKPAGQLAL